MIKLVRKQIITQFEKGPIRRSLFSNGAVSLFHRHPGMHSSVVSLYFLVGSRHEKRGQEGIVHLIEHMLFKEAPEGASIIKKLERAGADINAYTYKEFVCFEMDCSSTKLAEFLPLFLQLFFHPTFDAKELDLEKQVVIQELMDEEDDHETWGHDFVLGKLLDHSFGHSIGGSPKSVAKFTRKHLLNFFQQHFTPDRMVLSVTSGSAYSGLEKTFLKSMQEVPQFCVSGKPIRAYNSDVITKTKSFNKSIKRKLENSIYYLATGGPSIASRYFYELAVIDQIFFEGLSSKFYMQLRERQALLYGLGSVINSFCDNGLYVMIFNGSTQNIKNIKKSVKKLLEYYQEHGFDAQEVEDIKDRMINAMQRSFDYIDDRNEFMAMREILGDGNFSLKKDLKNIQKVTPKGLKYLLNKMFGQSMAQLTLVPEN